MALGLLTAAYLWFVCTDVGQRQDNWLWEQCTGFDRSLQADISWFARRPLVLITGLAAVLYAVGCRSWKTAVTLLVCWPCTVGAAYLMREGLFRPYLGNNGGFPVNSFPSTHVALAATPLVVIVIIRWSTGLVTLLCGLGVLFVMFGNLMLHVHRPSDSIGSVALAVALVAAVSFLLDRIPDRRARLTHT